VASTTSKEKAPVGFLNKEVPHGEIPPELQELVDKEQDKQIAEWIKNKYQKCKQDRTGIQNQWYINLAFYKGDQYVNLINGQLFNAPPIPSRVRLTINRIRPAMRTQVSRMVSQKPSATVIPASSEDEDILGAEAGEAVWEHQSETEEYQKHLIDASWWASNTGVGYIKTEWDKSWFDKDANNGEGANGKIKYSAPTPFHVHVPNLLARDIEDQPFVIHSFTMTIEEAKMAYGDMLPKDHQPTVIGTNEIMETAYLNLKGSEPNAMPDSCLILEAWIKPGATPLFPKGGMAIIIDDVVVYKTTDGIPYSHGQYPFAKLDDVLSGGYYSTSVIEDLIPLNKEYNRNRSQGVEIRNLGAKPGYFVQEGSVDLSKWKARAGQLIPVKPGFANPVPIQLPQVSPAHMQELEIIKQDFEDISGQHQVSKGTAPSGVTAATAISFLQEQDQSFMAPTYTSIELMTQKVARQTLQLAVQYWDEPRLIKAVGSDQAMSVRYMGRADIKNGTDIRVEGGSSIPQSKAARTAFIMDLINKGLIPADKGLEMLNMPNMRSYYQLIKIDENHATRENIKLRQLDPLEIQQIMQDVEMQKQQYLVQNGFVGPDGQPDEMAAREDAVVSQMLDQLDRPMLPVNDWDNDEIHIFTHEKFMKSQAFEMLDRSVQEQFVKHVEAHKAKQQSVMLNKLLQGGTSGGPDLQAMMGEAAGAPMEAGGMPAEQSGANQGGNPDGANQFSGIEQPVDPSQGQ
jgi:hypothetical protein